MVGVIVREQHGVDQLDLLAQELKPQLRRRIDQNHGAVVRLHGRTDASATIAWITRVTDRAVATELRNTEAGAGAEKSQFHTEVKPSRLS